MSRLRSLFSTFLIVLPYLLMSAVIWLGYGPAGELGSLVWRLEFRWLLWAIYFGAAFLGWRAGRPSWFYSWLGFAVWETAIMLFDSAERLPGVLNTDRHEVIAEQAGYGLAILALILYLLAPLWAGWHRPRSLLSAYTVFPHAALTYPLVALAQGSWFYLRNIWFLAILSLGISAAAALLFWRPPAFLVRAGEAVARGAVLYGGVFLAQSTLWIGMGLIYEDERLTAVRPLNEFTTTGLMLLSGAVLLPFLVRVLLLPVKFSYRRIVNGATRDRRPSIDNSDCQNTGRDESGTE